RCRRPRATCNQPGHARQPRAEESATLHPYCPPAVTLAALVAPNSHRGSTEQGPCHVQLATSPADRWVLRPRPMRSEDLHRRAIAPQLEFVRGPAGRCQGLMDRLDNCREGFWSRLAACV